MKTKVIQLIALSLLASWVSASSSQAISITQAIDKTEMAFEDSAVFEITVEWPGSQLAYRFPSPLNPYIDRLKIGKFSSSVTSIGAGESERTVKTFKYVLRPTSSGLGKVDAITISYLTWPDSVAGELVTEPVTINIAEQKIVAKPDKFPIWIPLVGAVMLLAGGTFAFLSVAKSRKEKKPLKTPAQTALEELTILKSETGIDLKRFQTGVYNILSKFLSAKFGLNVNGQSEKKLEELLAGAAMTEQNRLAIKNWLVQAEKDKFRPVEAEPGETIRLETELRKFFETLK